MRTSFRLSLSSRWLALPAALVVYAPVSASAQLVGSVNIFGAVRLSAAGGGIGTLDFLPPAGGSGDFVVDAFTPTGVFAPLAGTSGKIRDIDPGIAPVGVPIALEHFLTFTAAPHLDFTLRFVNPGVFGTAECGLAAAAGQNCTPDGTPFNLTNLTDHSSTASFAGSGTVTDGTHTSDVSGLFTAQFADMDFQQLMAELTGGGTVGTTFSASFVVTSLLPEPPAASLLACGGLALVGVVLRRRR